MPPLIEVRPANDRGLSTNWSANCLARGGVANLGPVDHHVLGTDARPLDKCQSDAAIAAGPDGIEDARIGNGGGVAVALQLELCVVDAA